MKKPARHLPLPALALVAASLLGCSKGAHSAEASASPSASAPSSPPPAPPLASAPSSPALAAPQSAPPPDARKFDVTFESGGRHMRGWVVRTPGAPPAPAIVYNHGSTNTVDWGTYGDLATWLVSQGYVVFFPFRRGVEGSEGDYLDPEVAKASDDSGKIALDHLLAENDDVTAAIAWIGAQAYVDPKRIAVAGCSYGGIETLFSAERATNIYAAVDFAGASATWAGSPLLQQRMTAAAHGARVPVMFIQAKNDFNTAPSEILSAAMRADGKDGELRIYPPRGEGPREGHAFCVTGMMTWGPDVVEFLKANERR